MAIKSLALALTALANPSVETTKTKAITHESMGNFAGKMIMQEIHNKVAKAGGAEINFTEFVAETNDNPTETDYLKKYFDTEDGEIISAKKLPKSMEELMKLTPIRELAELKPKMLASPLDTALETEYLAKLAKYQLFLNNLIDSYQDAADNALYFTDRRIERNNNKTVLKDRTPEERKRDIALFQKEAQEARKYNTVKVNLKKLNKYKPELEKLRADIAAAEARKDVSVTDYKEIPAKKELVAIIKKLQITFKENGEMVEVYVNGKYTNFKTFKPEYDKSYEIYPEGETAVIFTKYKKDGRTFLKKFALESGKVLEQGMWSTEKGFDRITDTYDLAPTTPSDSEMLKN